MRIETFTFEPSQVAEFAAFPAKLYADDPLFIPTHPSQIVAQLSEANPFFKHGAHRAWLARAAGGEVIGRVVATIDRRLVVEGDQVGYVGFFEVVEDESVASVLLDAATSWLRKEGARRIWGPIEFSIFNRYRFKTKGLELGPFAGEPHNKPYYPDYFTRYGFTVLERSASWDLTPEHIERVLTAIAATVAEKDAVAAGYRYRPFDVSRYDEDFAIFYELTIDAFTAHTGFVPVDLEEFSFFNAGVRLLLDPRTVVMIVSPEGEVIGAGYAYPDVAPLLRATRGAPDEASIARYYRETPPTTLVFHTGMVRPAHRTRGTVPGAFKIVWEGGVAAGLTSGIGGFAKLDQGSVFEKVYSVAPRTREYTLYELKPA